MKTRARRLAEILERDYDYVVYQNEKICPKCKGVSYSDDAFYCSKCGTKLKRNVQFREQAEADLESALCEAGIQDINELRTRKRL